MPVSARLAGFGSSYPQPTASLRLALGNISRSSEARPHRCPARNPATSSQPDSALGTVSACAIAVARPISRNVQSRVNAKTRPLKDGRIEPFMELKLEIELAVWSRPWIIQSSTDQKNLRSVRAACAANASSRPAMARSISSGLNWNCCRKKAVDGSVTATKFHRDNVISNRSTLRLRVRPSAPTEKLQCLDYVFLRVTQIACTCKNRPRLQPAIPREPGDKDDADLDERATDYSPRRTN